MWPEDVIAIACADIHLSHNAPVSREAESDWYDCMERSLCQVRELKAHYDDCPIICAGDVFDKWNSPPELINFALDKLPRMYAIPGQHDLPLHNHEDVHKSAYATLVKAGKIFPIMGVIELAHLYVVGFSWKQPICAWDKYATAVPPTDLHDPIKVAVLHSYVWSGTHFYMGAPDDQNASVYSKALRGYDTAIFGDNHKGFTLKPLTRANGTTGPAIMNCGTLIRRKIDEINYKPQVGLIHSDGKITPHYLDVTGDKFLDADEYADRLAESELDAREFIEELASLQDGDLDFKEAVKAMLEKTAPPDPVRRLVLQAMEGDQQ